MKSGTKLLFLVSLLISSPVYGDEFLSSQLKNAALQNGYLSPTEENRTFDLEKARLGNIFFNAKELSFNGDTSCSSCHIDKFSSADGLPNAIGVGGKGEERERMAGNGALVPRNTLPLWGRAGRNFFSFFWDGKVEKNKGEIFSQFGSAPPSKDPLTVAIHLPFLEIREMVVDDGYVTENLKKETLNAALEIQRELLNRIKYKLNLGAELSTAFNIQDDELEFNHVAQSIAHFFADKFALQSTAFSKFIVEDAELSKSQLMGGITFYGKGMCSSCHSGSHFSDFKYHTILFPQAGPGKNGFGNDYGRFNITFDYNDMYRFRTPPLHNVEKTAPYGHSGSMYELSDTIMAHYDPLYFYDFEGMTSYERRELYGRIIKTSNLQALPSKLSREEISNLVDFLKALSF